MVERHFLEQAERGAKPVVYWSGRVVVQHLLCQGIVPEGGRRDRGVGVCSKMTLIQTRDERRKQLAFANRPFRGASHDRVRVRGMRSAKQVAPIPQGPHHIGRTKT
jgi:hypothetical protein